MSSIIGDFPAIRSRLSELERGHGCQPHETRHMDGEWTSDLPWGNTKCFSCSETKFLEQSRKYPDYVYCDNCGWHTKYM